MISVLVFVLLASYVNAACDSTGGVRCYKGSDCCSGYKCYEKNAYWAACKQSCDPNWVDPYDNLKWTCNVLSPCDTSGSVRCYSNADCCGGYTCYEKNAYWAACKPTGSCDPNWVDPYDNIKWTCNVLSGSTTTSSGAPAVTTRYWDCCKPSCGWASNVQNLKAGYTPVRSCNKDGSLATVNSKNICVGGGDSTVSYTCTDQLPFESNGVLYAFAAANLPCCACYKISFANGKSITVQVTNSGSDLGTAHFDIMMPGGGFGIYNGCAENSGTPKPANGPAQFTNAYSSWGAQYGGVSSLADCNNLPAVLQPGCQWRFTSTWANMDNPQGTYTRVKCPAALVAKSNCLLNDDPVA